MTQRANILQELRELESPLATYNPVYPGVVPEGYFDGLADQVLRRIRAMEAGTAAEEIAHLSPLLSGLTREMPGQVPAGYFEELEASLLTAVSGTDRSAREELESLSPLLSGLKKDMPYSVPQGYFEQLPGTVPVQVKTAAPVLHMGSRRWMRYAAAAVITGLIAVTAFLYSNRNNQPQSMARFEEKINKEIKKTSDKDLNEFMKQFDDAGLTGEETATTGSDNEIKTLLKDIPESELKKFLEETAETESNTDEAFLMN